MANVYSDLKFLRFGDRLEAVHERRLVAPVHVRIKPINRCNHDCWYCAYRVSNLKLGDKMREDDKIPEDRMMMIADDLVSMGVKAVTFSGGGEPLLYRPLPRVIQRLAFGGIRIGALTNGSNLQGAMADAFASYGTWVRVSVDAWDDSSYRQSRGLRGDAFSRLLDNLKAFSARRSKCSLGVSFIISQDNYTYIPNVCRQFKEAGVQHLKLSGVVIANDVAANNKYHQEIAPAVAVQIASARAELEDEGFKLVDHYHELETRFDKAYSICPFMQFLTVIGADECVYSCQDKAYSEDGRLGSFAASSFKEFWFSEENRRRVWNLNPSVQCRHHCVAHRKNEAILDYLSIDREHGYFV